MSLNLQKLLHTILLRSPTNLFDEFIVECMKWYSKPAHTFTEMRNRENKKVRGDIFEEFCVLYLKHVKKYKDVWRLEDVPDDILQSLALKRRDMGIDIIIKEGGVYSAVQCKYKKHSNTRKNSVSWKSLSTFYALCSRTGKEFEGRREWNKYIIMTNCDFARHEGERTDKDLSICIGTFRKISLDEWTSMCDLTGHIVGEGENESNYINETNLEKDKDANIDTDEDEDIDKENIKKKDIKKPIKKIINNPTKEELRLLRLAYYDKKTNI
jgi:hypothetical protein